MQFNSVDYDADLEALKLVIGTDPDQSWAETIDQRWGLFMVEQGDQKAKSLYELSNRPESQNASSRAALKTECQKLAQHMLQAAGFLSGGARVKDPVTAEATLHLYYKRSRPQTAKS